MSAIQGGNFWTGFASRTLSSIAASAWGGGDHHDGLDAGGKPINPRIAMKGLGEIAHMGGTGGTIIFGSIMGGTGAALTKGNFWQGAVTGAIVSGLNHLAHKIDAPGEKKGKYYYKKPKHNADNPLQEHYDEAVTLSEWSKANDGLTREQIINQRANRSSSPLNSQQGGPNLRYVFHPKTGNVIDMRHMLIMGNNGPLVGNMVEVGQQMAGLASGLNRQDFYSNSLGYGFYNTYNDTGVQLMRFLGVGTNFSSSVDNYLNR